MPLSQDAIKEAGRMLADAWNNRRTLDALPEHLFPTTLVEATAIQDATALAIGQKVVGWKIGGGPGALVGRVYASHCHANPAVLSARQYPASNIECEVGFRITRDLPPRAEPYKAEEVLGAAVLCFTIELTGSRITGGKHTPENDRDLLLIVADNAAGAGLIPGPEVTAWHHLALLGVPVELRINGGAAVPMNPSPRTDPRQTLVWVANELSRRGYGLQAGQWITPGSATKPMPLRPGDQVVARFANFGNVTISLAAD